MRKSKSSLIKSRVKLPPIARRVSGSVTPIQERNASLPIKERNQASLTSRTALEPAKPNKNMQDTSRTSVGVSNKRGQRERK